MYQSLTIGPVTFDVPGGLHGSSDLWVSDTGSYQGLGEALVGNYPNTTVRATFSPATLAVGSDVYHVLGSGQVTDTISVTVSSNGGESVYSLPTTFASPSFFGVITDTGYISSITFGPPSTYWVGIDNFSYAGSANVPVPLPPSVLLLAPGLVGLIGMRRRFKA